MSSPGANAEEEKAAGKITFRFCRECANMLYPKEDLETNTLEFACKTCTYTMPAETACVFRHQLSNTVGATSGVTQDVAQDPTVGLPSVPDFCTLCGQEIFCEICGQETDRGFFLEVDEGTDPAANAAQTGPMAHTSMPPDSTPQELATSQQQLEQLRLEQQSDHPPTDSQNFKEGEARRS
ncbi:hypothetical protein BLS_008615 [Venturia inaequalis]|uniref:DNA-directed RNA polymerase II subunit RPB9-like zinc ribbon domain-containing protein n=1 Tax=Venturia inaequalis TaxID=5025 RepID=A0A8H3USF9_VENIN|nr:hypothetical protein EG328_003544 [Venturia inaequalis]KAE9980545.1 hypothetical protein BLS_008615 [Venturia inaequalis]RDI80851.1 hypothetical protein Vi05172_g9247 [Venturia inaequalis]